MFLLEKLLVRQQIDVEFGDLLLLRLQESSGYVWRWERICSLLPTAGADGLIIYRFYAFHGRDVTHREFLRLYHGMMFRFGVIVLIAHTLLLLRSVLCFCISIMEFVFRHKQKWVVVDQGFGFRVVKLWFYSFEPFWLSRPDWIFEEFLGLAILLLELLVYLFRVDGCVIIWKRIERLTVADGWLRYLIGRFLFFLLLTRHANWIFIVGRLVTVSDLYLLGIGIVIDLQNILVQIDGRLPIDFIFFIDFVRRMPVGTVLMLKELRLWVLVSCRDQLVFVRVDLKTVRHDLPHWIARLDFLAVVGQKWLHAFRVWIEWLQGAEVLEWCCVLLLKVLKIDHWVFLQILLVSVCALSICLWVSLILRRQHVRLCQGGGRLFHVWTIFSWEMIL